MAELVIVSGMNSGQSFPLHESALTIGRHGTSQVQLWDPKVSREHARIEKRPDGYHVVDLNSRNRTYVNGKPVNTARLANGDRIKIGETVFAFSVEGSVSFSEAKQDGFVTVVDRSLRTHDAKIVDRKQPATDAATLKSTQTAVEILQNLAELATSSSHASALLDGAMDLAMELVGGDRGFICVAGAKSDSFAVKASRPRASAPQEISLSKTILEYAIRRGESVLCADLKRDPRFTDQMSVKAHCMRSAIYVPLKVRERIIGILGVDTPSPHKRFSTKHLQYLSAFGNHLAVALQNLELRGEAENRRIIEAQLQTAREIQASFLPSQPIRVQGLDYAAKMVPAMYVGGDFYDWMFLKDGRIAFAIGDVSGKGVPAALSMARIMGFLRGLTATLDNAGQIIKTLNKSLLGSEIAGVFTTMALAIFDANGKTLELSIAGHPPPVIYPATRRTCELLTGDYGPPLGVVQDLNWQSVTRKLAANDLVVFYTDGIVEAGAKAIDIKPLQQVVEKTAGLAPHQIVQGILDSIASDEARHDDATLLALKVV